MDKDKVQQDINAYKKLAQLNKSDDLNEFFDLVMNTVARKLIWSVTTDNIKSYEDFRELKGEITSYLFPIQEVKGADAMAKHLKEQLTEFYNQQ